MIQKLGGGAIYYNAKGQTLRQVNRVSVPPVISGSQIQHLRIFPELLKSCICDPEIRGGGIYCNAKGQTLRQVKERRWPLLIVVKKSYKLQVTRKGKATIRVRVPPP